MFFFLSKENTKEHFLFMYDDFKKIFECFTFILLPYDSQPIINCQIIDQTLDLVLYVKFFWPFF